MKRVYYKPMTCLGCGKSFGQGKGVFHCARHACDMHAKMIAVFFKAGVTLETCANAVGVTYNQAQHLLRWVMR